MLSPNTLSTLLLLPPFLCPRLLILHVPFPTTFISKVSSRSSWLVGDATLLSYQVCQDPAVVYVSSFSSLSYCDCPLLQVECAVHNPEPHINTESTADTPAVGHGCIWVRPASFRNLSACWFMLQPCVPANTSRWERQPGFKWLPQCFFSK